MHVDRTAQVSHSPAALRRGGLCGKRLKGSKDVQGLVSRKWGFTDVGILTWRDPPGYAAGSPLGYATGSPLGYAAGSPLGYATGSPWVVRWPQPSRIDPGKGGNFLIMIRQSADDGGGGRSHGCSLYR